MEDLAGRLANRVQLTSDGLKAVPDGGQGRVRKRYRLRHAHQDLRDIVPKARSATAPRSASAAKRKTIKGHPDPKHISTSYIERQNLTVRMHNRRFTRLTNAFSKKIENHAASLAIHYMHYNFVRIHQSLRVTPAMAAGVTQTLWSIEDIVKLLDRN